MIDTFAPWLFTLLLLVPGGDDVKNPWKTKVADAVRRAEADGSVEALSKALDVAWRADDWQAGLKLARRSLEKHADAATLHGLTARALWRAGHLPDAEKLAARIAPNTEDRVALGVLITMHLARGELDAAAKVAARLEALKPATAMEWMHVLSTRNAQNRLEGVGKLVREIKRLHDPKNGYPEMLVGDSVEGMEEYFEAIGPKPVNQIAKHGAAPMTVTPVIRLPGCEVFINGHGPYRMIVDTGGSIALSVDNAVADEIGLKSIVSGSIHGVAGKDTSGQALIEELRIGDIVCKRVMSRVFGLRKATMGACDGILGTGIFGDGRMTLDFEKGQIIIAPSGETPGVGAPLDIRIVGDSKLMAFITVQGEYATALLDSGADVMALSPSRLKKLFPGRKIETVPMAALGVGADQMPGLSMVPGVDLTLAGRKYANVGGLGLDVLDNTMGPILGLQADVLIGMSIFRDMKSMTVDFPRCKLWVDWLPSE